MNFDIALVTTRYRGLLQVQNVLNNIAHLDTVPTWDAHKGLLSGRMAVLVGAGPSLDESIADLRAIQDHAFICAVNTAAPALAAAGIRIDLVVALENLDMTRNLHGVKYGALAVSLSTAPELFERATFFTVDPNPNWLRIARRLHTEPVHHGHSALCFGYSLLGALGADAVVLVGADLSVPKTGKMYAAKSGWDGITVSRNEQGRVICHGDEERQQLHWDSGVPAPPTERMVSMQVEAIGGGMVDTLPEFLTQLGWLEQRATASQPRLLNATASGAALGQRCSLTDVGQWSAVPLVGQRTPPPPGRAASVRAMLSAEGKKTLAFAERLLARDFDPLPCPPTAPLIYAMAAPDIIGLAMDHPQMERHGKFQATYEIWAEASRRLVEVTT